MSDKITVYDSSGNSHNFSKSDFAKAMCCKTEVLDRFETLVDNNIKNDEKLMLVTGENKLSGSLERRLVWRDFMLGSYEPNSIEIELEFDNPSNYHLYWDESPNSADLVDDKGWKSYLYEAEK